MIEFFVHGKLTNPLNGSLSRAHWTHKHAWVTQWKHATWAALHDDVPPEWFRDPAAPKHVAFLAQVGRQWDDDNLPAAIKPVRDALMGLHLGQLVRYRLIHSDAPDSGHRFTYEQRVSKERGVRVRIAPREEG